MKPFVKMFILILALLGFNFSYSQIVVDTSLKAKYDSIMKLCDKGIQKKSEQMDKMEDYSGGYVLFIKSATDTLNKKIFKKQFRDVVISDLDGNVSTREQKEAIEDLAFCGLEFLEDDTLKISIGFPFDSKSISHLIIKNKVKTEVNIYYKNNSILKKEIKSKKLTNNLFIKGNALAFSLSDTKFANNKIIYGFAEINSDEFYCKDFYNEDQFLQLRYKMKYYFKFKVKKDSN